jgi:Transposase DDE domain
MISEEAVIMTESEQGQGDGTAVLRERLDWQCAQRDDRRVAQALYQGEEVDAIHELSEAGLLDGFFCFLDELGMLRLLGEQMLPGVQRVLVPTVQFVVLYLLKVLYGIPSMNALPVLLFSNEAAMTLVGFNARQIANGLTRRGDAQRQEKRKQGPISPQCLAQNISKFSQTQLEGLLNRSVQLLVAQGFIGGEVLAALDGSQLRTPKSYPGCGRLAVTRQVREKDTNRLVKVVECVFGWKVLVLIDVRTRLPLAMKVVHIHSYEGAWLLPLVEQAQANLGDRARITKVVVDRGYLDGEDLWQLDQRGIRFVIVAKAAMVVAQDARALAARERGSTRKRVVRHGHGQHATTQTLKTVLVGIPGLTTYDAYGDPEHTKQHLRTDYAGIPINAVVVRTWDNRTFPDGGTVYLTNGPVTDPFAAFDDYDWRSVIENGIFKEGKYPWQLTHFPQRTEAAVIVHCHFTLLVMALTTAYRLWQAQQAHPDRLAGAPLPPGEGLSSTLLGGEGTERWRRRLKEENRDKVIVFVGDRYGIFHLAELSVLTGIRLKALPLHLGSWPEVLTRYGLAPSGPQALAPSAAHGPAPAHAPPDAPAQLCPAA